MAGELYGEKCLKCTHVRHDNRVIDVRWPVDDDDCQDCYECQDSAFWGALIRACGGERVFSPETRAALQAFRNNRPHPLIDQLRADIQATTNQGENT